MQSMYMAPISMNGMIILMDKLIIQFIHNKKMQHSCGVTHSIALSYQFQNTTILVNLFQLGLHQI